MLPWMKKPDAPPTAEKLAYVQTYGCQMNKLDSELALQALVQPDGDGRGLVRVLACAAFIRRVR